MHVFKFPENENQFAVSTGLYDLSHRLKQHEKDFEELTLLNLYRIEETERSDRYYLTARCRYCKSQLKYSKKASRPQSEYKLHKFMNLHEHQISKDDIKKEMIEYVKTLFGKVAQEEMKLRFLEKFTKDGATVKHFQRSFSIIRKQHQKLAFIDELNEFGNHNYLSKVDVNPLLKTKSANKKIYPFFLFISTQEMKNAYERFGRVIYIHRFPYLILKDQLDDENWVILIISGVDNYNNIIFYGFSICEGFSVNTVFLTVHTFFTNLGHTKICETIITEEEEAFEKGVSQELNNQARNREHPKIAHIYDLMLNVKDANEERKKTLRSLISTYSEKEFDSIKAEYRNKIKSNDATNFEVFLNKSKVYCLLKIPHTFVGAGVGLEHFTSIFKTIVRNFPREEEYRVFVFKFTSFLRTAKIVRNKPRQPKEILISPLSDCYPYLSEYALNSLYERLIESAMLNINPLQEMKDRIKVGSCTVYISRKEPQDPSGTDHQEHRARKTQPNAEHSQVMFDCECRMKKKTGLPCIHILRVCFYFQIPIFSQVDDFWNVTIDSDASRKRDSAKLPLKT